MSGKRFNPFQHALKRPDMYLGDITTITSDAPLINTEGIVETKSVNFNQGLINIIREIGSNCVDNGWRSKEAKIPMTTIKVTFSSSTYEISFYNDGFFISAEKKEFEYEDHRTGKVTSEEMYPAELYFGDMLASTNYDDDVVRKTSGRNGMGAKVTVVFSKSFTVEHTDPEAGKKFVLSFSNNAKIRTKPKLTAFSGKTGWTKITFIPDYERFGYDISANLDDFIGMLKLCSAEIAAVTGIPVTFTLDDDPPKKYVINTFEKYTRLFYPDIKNNKLGSIKLPNGDECVVVESHPQSTEEELDDCQHFAYVNGIRTKLGGIHVNAWRDTIMSAFVRTFNARPHPKGKTNTKTTAKKTYPYLTFFIRTELDKPAFESQTKQKLNGRQANKSDKTNEAVIADYKIIPPGKSPSATRIKEDIDELVIKMMKWNFISSLEAKLSGKTEKLTVQSVRKHKKIHDCTNAIAGKAHLCTLWISEGLSPHALIVNGVSSIDDLAMDSNGMYAIQGKFLNVKVATKDQIQENQEIKDIQSLLGLGKGMSDTKTDFTKDANFKRIRYHKVRLAADMDEDGIHIRGLLINFFYHLYPTLFDREDFCLDSFSTGAVKVTLKGKKDPLIFYSNLEYKKWYDDYTVGPDLESAIKEAKYLKGLAAINDDDVPLYFADPKIVTYHKEGDEDAYMDLAFGNDKKKGEQKKNWIIRDMRPSKLYIECDSKEELSEDEDTIEDPLNIDFVYEGKYGISTFVDEQLSIYNRMSLHRALPDDMDGFKESQRKIIFGIMKIPGTKNRDLEKVIGKVKEVSQYHHGGTSISGAIVGMATRYPGDNNIPYLQNDGQYATRLLGPSEFGADRYLHTHIEPIIKTIFMDVDNAVLERLISDNVAVEYRHFVPVINMLAVNGCKGIATGFSTTIPAYNPIDILDRQEAWLNGTHDQLPPMVPWYRGINGPIQLIEDGKKWSTEGILTECPGKGCKMTIGKKKTKCPGLKGWWHITDLPVGLWSSDFKEKLDKMSEDGKDIKGNKIPKKIVEYRNYCTKDLVHFIIKPVKDWEPDIDTTFKCMKKTYSLMNMITIDQNHYPTRHESIEDIIYGWMPRRLHFYKLRKEYLLSLYEHDKKIASNRYLFVKAVAEKKLDMHRPKKEVEKEMIKMKFEKLTLKYKSNNEVEDDEEDSKEKKRDDTPSFKYLTSMQILSMTNEKLEKLKKEIDTCQQKIDTLSKVEPADLWRTDMKAVRKAWLAFVKENPHL